MTGRGVLALVLALLLTTTTAVAGDPTVISGTIHEDQVWSGEILLAGDVLVQREATIRVKPGTQILAVLPRDIRRVSLESVQELNPRLIEIHVRGAIEAVGNATAPIRFGRSVEWSGKYLSENWLGIVLHPLRDRLPSRFAHCEFAGALGGVQCGAGSPVFEDCLFQRCSIGLGVGTIRGDRRGRRGIDSLDATPSVRRCRFFDCETGVYVDGGGRPSLERSVILSCRIGVGQWYGGMTGFIEGLGPLIDRCDFIHNKVATVGSGSVQNSIFRGNGLVFSASPYHRLYASQIDRVHRSHNVFFDNDALMDDDLPLGGNATHSDPGYEGPIAADMQAKDVWTRVALRPESPVLGKASDGGDPGCRGAMGSAGTDSAAEAPPVGAWALPGWLIPGPTANLDEKARGKLIDGLVRRGARLPSPGRRADSVLWTLFRPEKGVVVLPGTTGEILLVGALAAKRAGPIHLDFGLDGHFIAATWNATTLTIPTNRRRFTYRDFRRTVEAKPGRNLIVLRVRPPVTGGRLALHVTRDLTSAELQPVWLVPKGVAGEVVAGLTLKIERRSGACRAVVKLKGPVHWQDAIRPENWRMMDPDDRVLTPSADGVTYDVARRRILITGLKVRRDRVYRLLVGPIRDAHGRSIPAPEEPPSAKAR